MDFLENFLGEQGAGLIAKLVGEVGFGEDQAGRFLPAAAGKLLDAVKGGGFDVGSLLVGADPSSLISKVDVAGLATEVGGDESQTRSGLAALAPALLSALSDKAGGVDGIASLLGGDAGGVLGAASKLGGLFKS